MSYWPGTLTEDATTYGPRVKWSEMMVRKWQWVFREDDPISNKASKSAALKRDFEGIYDEAYAKGLKAGLELAEKQYAGFA